MAEYIKKAELMSLIESEARIWGDDYDYLQILGDIEDFPPADVRPVVRGQWKPFDLTYGRSIYACTSCEEATCVPTEMGTPMYRYCPNCGSYNGGDAE